MQLEKWGFGSLTNNLTLDLSGSMTLSLALSVYLWLSGSLSLLLSFSLAPITDGGMDSITLVVCEHRHLDLLNKTIVPQPSWPSTVGVASFLLHYWALYYIASTPSYSSQILA